MKVLLCKRFWETVPLEKKKAVWAKLPQFVELLSRWMQEGVMPSGLYMRRLMGAKEDIYKFRLNNKDRIAFMYTDKVREIRQEYRRGILFIAYWNHDEQSRQQDLKINPQTIREVDLGVDTSAYSEEEDGDAIAWQQWEATLRQEDLLADDLLAYVLEDEQLGALAAGGVKGWQYYLNTEQYHCVRADTALFLSGGAGTGKSTVGLHKLIRFGTHASNRLAYFTYTERLCADFKGLYEEWREDQQKIGNRQPAGKVAKPEFHTFNSFCRDLAGHTRQSLVCWPDFRDKFCKKRVALEWFRQTKIDPADVWNELRGLVKGSMGQFWLRREVFDQRQGPVSEAALALLLQHKQIKEVSPGLFTLTKEQVLVHGCREYDTMWAHAVDMLDVWLADELDSHRIRAEIKQALTDLWQRRFSEELLRREVYYSLPQDFSIHNEAEKSAIYDLALEYQRWLKQENRFDENDLARAALGKLAEKSRRAQQTFDYVVIDEAQDLSELQLYLLLSLHCRLTDYFISGDLHQIVNPTFFRFGRLQMPFHYEGVSFEPKMLNKNYRSQGNIVQLSNAVATIRRACIGDMDEFPEERALQAPQDNPFLLMPSPANKEKLLQVLRQEHEYVAVVVPNEEHKQLVAAKLGSADRVFTVQEIKGLEYDYVIGMNLLSANDYGQRWQEIFAGQGHQNTKYRYYFNIFYVAVTRARKNLLLYEDRPEHLLLQAQEVRELLEVHTSFDQSALRLQDKANVEQLLNDAKGQEDRGEYNSAAKLYRKLGDHVNADRNQAKFFESKQEFRKAMTYFYKAGDYTAVMRLAQHHKDEQMRLLVLLAQSTSPEDFEQACGCSSRDLAQFLAEGAEDATFREDIQRKYLGPKMANYQRIAEHAGAEIDDILEFIKMV